MSLLHRTVSRLVSRAGLPLAVFALLLCLAATPALAQPSLGVKLERKEGPEGIFAVVHHSDERVDFTATVTNTAPKTESVPAGTTLTCESGTWTQEETSGFKLSFEWRSNGAPASGTATQTGPKTGTYQTTAADEGHAIQCVVTAQNAAGAGIKASLPLGPSSAPAYAGSGNPEPKVSSKAAVGNERQFTCTPPVAGVWTGSPVWSYQWLRNGAPISGATSPTYTAHIGSGEADSLVALQCELIGQNSGGTILTISNFGFTGTGAQFEAKYGAFPPVNQDFFPPTVFNPRGNPAIVDPNTTHGPVTLEVELPAGEGTFAYKAEQQVGGGWSCDEIPALGPERAKAVCQREDQLAPGGRYSPLTVVAGLGKDAPDVASATATVFGGETSTAARAEVTFPIEPALPFGLSKFTSQLLDDEEHEYTRAGGHPFEALSELVFNRKRPLVSPGQSEFLPVDQLKRAIVELPQGFIGNASALPALCPGIEAVSNQTCPPGSAVGYLNYLLSTVNGERGETPIFAIQPEFGASAEFAFRDTVGRIYSLIPRLRPDEGYAISLEATPTPQNSLLEATVRFCGFGRTVGLGCRQEGEPGANPKPLLTMPTRCDAPLSTRVQVNSWEDPTFIEGPAFLGATMEGCDSVPFEPQAVLAPSSRQADSPTGLDVTMSLPTEGLEKGSGCHERQGDETSPVVSECIAQSDLREQKIAFPAGMVVNPSAAQGLSGCSLSQVGIENEQGRLVPNDAPVFCPESSKIGTVEIETPLLERVLKGNVYVSSQGAVEGSLIGLYLVFDSPRDGVLIKMPVKITPDPSTGQLTATVSELPQQPFSSVRIDLPGGPQAPMLTPSGCGSYQIETELSPWSGGQPVARPSTFEINEGPGGGACVSKGLQPRLKAGIQNPVAGATSPFLMQLSRQDGSQRFTGVNLQLPLGLTAYLKGVPECSDAALASISDAVGSGSAELASPSCPASSQIGTASVGVGGGPKPFYVNTSKVYFAGPYKGAPFSIAIVTPALAGPFDLGSVVVRAGLYIDPTTAQVTVKSDPIPTLVHGIVLDIRDIRVSVDRPDFMLAPTNCTPMTLAATVNGEDGSSASASVPFQVGHCANLSFKPSFKVSTSGETSRKDGASLHVRLTYPNAPQGTQANIHSVHVELPKALPSRLTTLNHACVDSVFDRDPAACPAASRVGYAKAVTPVLPVALEGPAYFVSHGGKKFPELTVVLQGDGVTVYLQGETFISKAGITSSTFKQVPDVPVGSFELTLPQGPNSALAANGNLCAKALKMPATFGAQNGALLRKSTPIEVEGCPYRLRILHRSVHRRTLRLKVAVPGAGRLVARGRGVFVAAKAVRGSRTLTLAVRERHAGMRRTKVVLTFTPSNGAQRRILRKSLSVTFRRR